MLRENEHGGYVIRQSDLGAFSRCQTQEQFERAAKASVSAPQRKNLSATVYGTVVHYALLNMEKLVHAGNEKALEIGIATFLHYWSPENIHLIADKIDTWLPRQTYGGLRDRGREAITTYYKLLQKDDSKLLALEYQFEVPLIGGDGRQHTLTGTVDRLSVRKWYGTPYISVDDFKTGKQPTYLRYHIQGTTYAYASMMPEFWTSEVYPSFDAETMKGIEHSFAKLGYLLHAGTKQDWWDGPAAKHLTTLASRRFRWINLQTVKYADGGWRGPIDYERMRTTVDRYVEAHEAGIFQLNLTGEVCVYCPFNHICTGTGIADEEHGQPPKRYSTREKASA